MTERHDIDLEMRLLLAAAIFELRVLPANYLNPQDQGVAGGRRQVLIRTPQSGLSALSGSTLMLPRL